MANSERQFEKDKNRKSKIEDLCASHTRFNDRIKFSMEITFDNVELDYFNSFA